MLKITKETKIGILGLAITGKSIYNYLVNHYNPNIICFDDAKNNVENFAHISTNANIVSLDNKSWTTLDIIFISPGIKTSHMIFSLASENNIPIRSDIDLFYSENPDAQFICITGSNGKTTTTMLISEVFKRAKLDFALGGNIGIPVLELAKNKTMYLLELSSFQTQLIKELNPKITALLNIHPNHLDVYKSIDQYYEAKKNLLTRSKIQIIGICNEISQKIFESCKANSKSNTMKIISFSNTEEYKYKTDFTIKQNLINDMFLDFEEYYFPSNKYLLNPNSVLLTYIITKLLNIKTEIFFHSLENFVPPKYRLEFLGKKNDISFYNDSKSTNTSSTYFALSSLEEIILIMGGVFKEKNLDPLKNISYKIKKIFIIGTNTQIFENFCKENGIKYQISIYLERAFNDSIKFAQNLEKSTILLSPAASSLDQFNSFEHRGAIFSELVNKFLYANIT